MERLAYKQVFWASVSIGVGERKGFACLYTIDRSPWVSSILGLVSGPSGSFLDGVKTIKITAMSVPLKSACRGRRNRNKEVGADVSITTKANRSLKFKTIAKIFAGISGNLRKWLRWEV